MERVYQLDEHAGAVLVATSWDSEPSGKLPLIFGYSYGIGPFVPHHGDTPLPPVPSATYLRLKGDWAHDNARRLELAWKFLGENDELENLLYTNLPSVEFNRYNLEVYLSIAKLCRQNLLMFQGLDEMNREPRKGTGRGSESCTMPMRVAALDSVLDARRDNPRRTQPGAA